MNKVQFLQCIFQMKTWQIYTKLCKGEGAEVYSTSSDTAVSTAQMTPGH